MYNDHLKKKAMEWYRSTSIAEEKQLVKEHPYYKNFGVSYVRKIKHGYVELYKFYCEQNGIKQ